MRSENRGVGRSGPALERDALSQAGREIGVWAVVLSIGVLLGWDTFDLLFFAWVDATAWLVLGFWAAFLRPKRRQQGGCVTGCMTGCASLLGFYLAVVTWLMATLLSPLAVARPDALVGADEASIVTDDFRAVVERVDAMVVVSAVALLAWIVAGEVRRRRSGDATRGAGEFGAAAGRSGGLLVALIILLENPGRGPALLIAAIVLGRMAGLLIDATMRGSGGNQPWSTSGARPSPPQHRG